MTYYERVDELRDHTNFTSDNYELEYLTAEIVLVDLFGEYIKDAEIISTAYGVGRVVNTSGDTLDRMIMEVAFTDGAKKFGVLPVITGKVLFSKFADISEVGDAWDHTFDLHTDMTKQLIDFKRAEKLAEAELKKKAAEDKKAEEQYQKAKAKTLKDFDTLLDSIQPKSTVDEFYHSLGWLTAHVGTVQAAIPDYLQSTFEARFGTDANPYVYDSKKKTSGGFRYQWSAGFHARLKKKGLTTIPAMLANYISDTVNSSKTIMDTAFILDLIENYGFQFGKTQDVDNIRSRIPSEYMSFFEAGLLA